MSSVQSGGRRSETAYPGNESALHRETRRSGPASLAPSPGWAPSSGSHLWRPARTPCGRRCRQNADPAATRTHVGVDALPPCHQSNRNAGLARLCHQLTLEGIRVAAARPGELMVGHGEIASTTDKRTRSAPIHPEWPFAAVISVRPDGYQSGSAAVDSIKNKRRSHR